MMNKLKDYPNYGDKPLRIMRTFIVVGVTFIGLSIGATSATAVPMWYKGLGNDGKQAGESGVPDFTWRLNCFATAAYNSLYWFFLNGYPNMVSSSFPPEEDINNLWNNYMQGSSGANHQTMFSGMLKWANEREPDPGWYGIYRGLQDSGNTIDPSWLRGGSFGYPTWDFYRDELKKSEDVILLFDWDDGKGGRIGHAITGAGVGDTDTERNWIGVSDPSDEGTIQHDFNPDRWQEYQLELDCEGYLYIPNYSLAGGKKARLYGVFAMSPIPEPSTLLLLGSGLVGLVGFGRKRLLKKG